MDADHGRERSIALLRPGHVELQVLVVGIGILNARLEEHVIGHDERFLSVGD